jgi:hypothetical protein
VIAADIATSAHAQTCTRQGTDVATTAGAGIFGGDAILCPDGTHSRATPHQSVVIGNKSSVVIGNGVFVGEGKGVVPLEDPGAPSTAPCAILEGAFYCC